ncbi:MAG TPA: hypothetical protein PLP33_24475 [Leptospiraceae bacterium]|nr:hypothetical protein [Leptospiraceae bacterium]
MSFTLKYFKIAWLDSCGFPSIIHSIGEDLQGTSCGHEIKYKNLAKVPTRIQGESRFCGFCFRTVKKNVDWHEDCKETEKIDGQKFNTMVILFIGMALQAFIVAFLTKAKLIKLSASQQLIAGILLSIFALIFYTIKVVDFQR